MRLSRPVSWPSHPASRSGAAHRWPIGSVEPIQEDREGLLRGTVRAAALAGLPAALALVTVGAQGPGPLAQEEPLPAA